ncbi:MAG: iron complex outermembrane receptor protein [Arenicella sp.]|jgi:iron complex outermembrane receptor protein
MFRKNKLSYAVAVAIGASLAAGYASAELEEIVVTATKRTESAQDIPVTVQAISGETLRQLGVGTFDEYVKYLPNVVQQGRGPGRNEIYIRGVAAEQGSSEVSSVQGSSPTVAMYLDEQPVSFGGRNLDIYAADLKRIEVLPGPQGTLFGASSQAGTVRLITNKPNHNEFSAGFKANQGWTKGGNQSTSTQAYINVPLSEKLAVRGVFYNDKQGGWYDNVQGQFGDSAERANVMNRNQINQNADVALDANIATPNNQNLIEEDFNDATYNGGRLGLAYDINDDWSILVQHTTQSLATEGAFDYAPYLDNNNEEATAVFSAQENNDEFNLTTWTLEGRLGSLNLLYTGGFLDREVNSIADYTNYTFGGGYQTYYICNVVAYGALVPATECFDPTKTYVERTENKRSTHEIRISSDAENRFRFTAGVYLDDSETKSVGEFQYFGAVENGFNAAALPNDLNGPIPGLNEPFGHGPASLFVNDYTRDQEQTAFFGEVSFDFTDDMTLTLGARNYDIDFELTGGTGQSVACKYVADPTALPETGDRVLQGVRPDGSIGCNGRADKIASLLIPALGQAAGGDSTALFGLESAGLIGGAQGYLDAIADGSLSTDGLGSDGVLNINDTITRVTLDWKPSESTLLYGTYSEGFRPPVLNRDAGRASVRQTDIFAGYRIPILATTDELDNFEIGFKGDLFDDTLRLNATYYSSEISDLQSSRFDPSNIGILVFVENIGDAEISGLDLDFQYVVSNNLSVYGAVAFVDSELTRVNTQLEGVAVPVGSQLPYTPEFSFNLRTRYDFDLSKFGADGYAQFGIVYTGDSKAGLVGSAFAVEDSTRRVYGSASGLSIEEYSGTFGSVATAEELPNTFGTTQTPDGLRFKSGRYVQEAYTLLNLSVGVQKDDWNAEFYINNIADERGQVHISSEDYAPSVSTSRPRTMGIRFSYDI